MKGVRNNHHHSYKLSFLLVLILLHPVFSTYVSTLSPTESLTVSSNRTIVSKGGDFELGFFKPSARFGWYLGILYKKVPQRTYVWVANRDKPLSKTIGTLKISGNNLVLLDDFDKLVWSTNLTRGNVTSPMVAELLSNGNFVMRHFNNNDPSGFLWQSFDFPTDTLLPQMKLGWDRKTGLNRFLRSWRSEDDLSSGNYLYKLVHRGFPEFFLMDEHVRVHRSGPWDGIQFNGMPEVRQLDYMVYNFTDNKDEVAYTFLMTNQSIYSRLTVSLSGALQRFTWTPPSYGWRQLWSIPKDDCDVYSVCGPYGYCDTNTSPTCNCIRGFDPINLQEWMLRDGVSGCVRRTQLNCEGDGFTQLRKIKLPDTASVIVDRNLSTEECKKRCLKDCNCTAFANADITKGGSGCVIWKGPLFDIRNYVAGGQDLYVRLAAADVEKERKISGKTIGLVVGIIIILLLCFTVFSAWKRNQNRARSSAELIVYQERTQDLTVHEVVISSRRHFHSDNMTEDLELPLLEFKAVVMATENFSECNMLGEGGFGVVYKGRLSDGQEIAVKRLSKMSLQGSEEFKNELKLIAKLQHINLVRLLGCCIDADEKMLIYEYLENLGLDSYLFDTTRSYKLDWQKRFDIANGIARGLLYLHQDSRFRIIHRDLKASNVLLDKDMTPKISDFGMARIFGRDETEANTRKVVGTYGYMSPEYAMEGKFSMKSDVFSFGVLLLEIISGRRNRGFYNDDLDINLLGCVWRNWKEGKGLEIVDPIIIDSSQSSTFRPHEILRCIQVGLLCIQERAHDRPYMCSVVSMLGSETATIPQPKPPGYSVERVNFEAGSLSSKQREDESWTINEIPVSVINAR